MEKLIAMLGLIIVAIVGCTLMGLVCSLPVMLLWNACLVGAIAGVSPIGWLQAWGILVLFGFLFKSSSTKSSN